jgi:hypothetical protein
MSDRIALIRHGSVTDIRAPGDLSHADLVRAATGEDTIQGRNVA